MSSRARFPLRLWLVAGLILMAALWAGLKMAGFGGKEQAALEGTARSKEPQPSAAAEEGFPRVPASGSWPERLSSIPTVQERQIFLNEQAGLLQGAEVIPLLLAAQRDTDPQVRKDALQLCGMFNEKEIDQAVLPGALFDSDAIIRDLAQHRVNELRDEDRLPYFEMMLLGPNEAQAVRGAEYLAVVGGKNAVAILVAALSKSGNPKLSGAVQKSLERLTGQVFRDAQAAAAWWQKNQDSFK